MRLASRFGFSSLSDGQTATRLRWVKSQSRVSVFPRDGNCGGGATVVAVVGQIKEKGVGQRRAITPTPKAGRKRQAYRAAPVPNARATTIGQEGDAW